MRADEYEECDRVASRIKDFLVEFHGFEEKLALELEVSSSYEVDSFGVPEGHRIRLQPAAKEAKKLAPDEVNSEV